MNKKGFTLLEMVIVMAVIVILFLLTMPNITNTMDVVNDKGCDAQIKVIDSAILQYKLKHDTIPTDINQLVSSGFISQKQTKCSNNKTLKITNGQAHE
ncbi:MAG: prepilin-type N-terminal cleavage/methylation domain-containing protein [Erysipelothrix sp.]|nr:prepilin-type N-terminal cleavage/methylation domain-containing protein [Erysipelothrix sp.]